MCLISCVLWFNVWRWIYCCVLYEEKHLCVYCLYSLLLSSTGCLYLTVFMGLFNFFFFLVGLHGRIKLEHEYQLEIIQSSGPGEKLEESQNGGKRALLEIRKSWRWRCWLSHLKWTVWDRSNLCCWSLKSLQSLLQLYLVYKTFFEENLEWIVISSSVARFD